MGLLVVAALLVGAGVFLLTQGDERSEEEQAYIDAMADYTQSDEESGFTLNGDQSRCFAAAVVDAVGVDRLRETATPREIRESDTEDPLQSIELDRGQAEAMYDQSDDCIDWRQAFLDAARDDGLTEPQLQCVNRNLGEGHVRDVLVASFDEDDEAMEEADRAIDDAIAPCEHAE